MADSLKEKALNGALWVTLEKLSQQVFFFVVSIVLARLLSPTDYGIVGMLGIFIAISGTFIDSGMGSALVQKQDRTEADYSTVFFFNLFISVLAYGLLYLAAPYIAAFYKTPILESVTRLSALSLIIGALSAIHRTRLTILLQFRLQSVVGILSMPVSGLIGIWLAYRGYGVWALVYSSLIGGAFTTILLWGVARWRPSFVFSVASFRALFGYGSKLLCSSLINTIYGNLYTLVIGRAFSAADVGYYNKGNNFARLPYNAILDTLLKVNFPILAKLQDDDKKLLNAYQKLLRLPMYVLYPMLIGLATVAEPLIDVMIGTKWLPCVPILQILCLGFLFSPLTHLNLNLLYVKGRTDLVLKLELIKKPIAFLILFATIPFGIIPLVIGKAGYEFIAFSFNCYYTKKLLNYGIWQQLKSLLPILFNCAVMWCVATLCMSIFDSPLSKTIVGITAGISSYIIYSILTRDACFLELLEIVKRKLFSPRASS